MIKFSVITPFYNRKEFLSETILSVLNQDYPEFEYILVDDGSNDGAWELAEEFSKKNPRIKLFRREGNKKGASVCRNLGLQNATGQQVIFLDSDDLLAPYCLRNRAVLIEKNTSLDFYVFPMLLFREKPDDMMVLQNILTKEPVLDRFLKRENVWLMSSVSWNIHFLKSLNGFDEECLSFQDWEINVRALLSTENFIFYDKEVPDNFYRQHGLDTISKNRYVMDHFLSQITMLNRIYLQFGSSAKLNLKRRMYLCAFFLEVADRFRILQMNQQERKKIMETILNSGVRSGLIPENEVGKLAGYLRRNSSRLAARVAWFRSLNVFINKKILLRNWFFNHSRSQSSVLYEKELV